MTEVSNESRRAQKERTRQAIMDAALQLAQQHGYRHMPGRSQY